jgi:hypothetical protein
MIAHNAESARGFAPRAAHRSGREPLDSSGSCHHREGCRLPSRQEFLRLPVDSIPTWVTCALRSAGVTLSTLRRHSYVWLRMTRGRCGSLFHIRMTFCIHYTSPV